jgi:competence CoiA-like predicted nuclease
MIDCLTNTEMNMNKIKEIVREYANEYFTNEMLLSGDETWDYAAQAWFDEHYPDLSDDDRHSFSSQLDRLYARRRYRATLQKFKAMEAENNTPFYNGMTKSEVKKKFIELLSENNYLEASPLINAYYGRDLNIDQIIGMKCLIPYL